MRPVFLDSSGIVCLLSQDEKSHQLAKSIVLDLGAAKRTAVTTDYILSESYTLLKARKKSRFIQPFRSLVANGDIQIAWTDRDVFKAAEQYFLRHVDKDYSFVDCLSFVVMKERRITDALTADQNFNQAGFHALLIPS